MRTWTPEARAAHSALIKRLKPWRKSTGPKTEEGKAKAAKNSYKHGLYAKPMKAVRKYFRDCRTFLKFLETKYYSPLPSGEGWVRDDVENSQNLGTNYYDTGDNSATFVGACVETPC